MFGKSFNWIKQVFAAYVSASEYQLYTDIVQNSLWKEVDQATKWRSYQATLICAIRFPHANSSTFHNILNIYDHSNKIQECVFTIVAIGMNKQIFHILILTKVNYYVPLSHKNNTNHECTWDTSIENFQTLYITKALQSKHNIAIAMRLNHPTIGGNQ